MQGICFKFNNNSIYSFISFHIYRSLTKSTMWTARRFDRFSILGNITHVSQFIAIYTRIHTRFTFALISRFTVRLIKRIRINPIIYRNRIKIFQMKSNCNWNKLNHCYLIRSIDMQMWNWMPSKQKKIKKKPSLKCNEFQNVHNIGNNEMNQISLFL